MSFAFASLLTCLWRLMTAVSLKPSSASSYSSEQRAKPHKHKNLAVMQSKVVLSQFFTHCRFCVYILRSCALTHLVPQVLLPDWQERTFRSVFFYLLQGVTLNALLFPTRIVPVWNCLWVVKYFILLPTMVCESFLGESSCSESFLILSRMMQNKSLSLLLGQTCDSYSKWCWINWKSDKLGIPGLNLWVHLLYA